MSNIKFWIPGWSKLKGKYNLAILLIGSRLLRGFFFFFFFFFNFKGYPNNRKVKFMTLQLVKYDS